MDYSREAADFELLKSHKAALFTEVAKRGFRSDEFEWRSAGSEYFGLSGWTVPVIIHRGSPYYFKLGYYEGLHYVGSQWPNDGNFFIQMSPSATQISEVRQWRSWEQALELFANWLDYLRRELAAPDPWTEGEQEQAVIEASWDVVGSDFDSDFTEHEVARIGESLDAAAADSDIKRLLTPEQADDLSRRLEEAKRAAQVSGRNKWIQELLRSLTAWAAKKAVESDAAREVFGVIASKLNWLTQHLTSAVMKLLGP